MTKLYGNKNPFFGKHHTTESKKKISNAKKGKNNGLKGRHWKLSEQAKRNIGLGHLDSKNGAWKGDKVKYGGIHQWLRKIFGNATKCENLKCSYPKKTGRRLYLKPKRFEWALLKGKKYERNRKNFWMLCTSCHRLYDNKLISLI